MCAKECAGWVARRVFRVKTRLFLVLAGCVVFGGGALPGTALAQDGVVPVPPVHLEYPQYPARQASDSGNSAAHPRCSSYGTASSYFAPRCETGSACPTPGDASCCSTCAPAATTCCAGGVCPAGCPCGCADGAGSGLYGWLTGGPLLEDTFVGRTSDRLASWHDSFGIPIGVGAWHWYHEDLSGPNDGYGIEGLRGTYYWYITADPEYDLGGGRAIGGHVEYRLRDGDPFRSFFDSNFWFYEAYGYYRDDTFGTFKVGQIWTRFGLDWDGVFFGNVPYFDGFKLDPDYGVSWERTTAINSYLSMDSYAQFFFHEDGVNGSFGGADPESVPGYNERNTGVVRLVPTWTFCDGSTLALGVSGLVGEIASSRSDLDDEVTGAWAADLTYTTGRWMFFGEVLQSYGIRNPVRYVSGGPSNRITDFLFGVHYTLGPVTYRTSYSFGFDDNPAARHNLLVSGATIALTDNVDLYVEYVYETVHGNATADFIEFFNSLEFALNWRF